MVFGIFATLAEFERDLIRERTMAGLASASARSQGRTKIRAHQSSGASRASRHGPARYFSFRSRKELGIERVTLYRYVGPKGELRDHGKHVLGLT